ncbi:MAG: sensor histidine kinase [Phycisphaerae bacterium]
MSDPVANVSPTAQPVPTTAQDEPVRKLEAQLAGLDHKFAELTAQVRQAQQLSAMGIAAATMAHEFNNLLAPVLAYAQAALNCDDPALSKKALTATVNSTRMLVAMSDRILGLTAPKDMQLQQVGVVQAVNDAVAALCRDLTKDGIRLVVDVGDDVTAWSDPLQLQQVFFNLFLNAREAMAGAGSGRLTVAAEPDGDRVVIKVQDTGKGIAADRVDAIFDALSTSKAVTDGAARHRCCGLGLALCRDLVEEWGGRISVASEVGAGTTFTMVLHRREPATTTCEPAPPQP